MMRTLRNTLFALLVVCMTFVFTCDLHADKVDDLIQNLSDKDSSIRCRAAEELGKLKDKRAVQPLIDLLENREIGGSKDAAGGVSSGAAQKVEQAMLAVGRSAVDLTSVGAQVDIRLLQQHVRALTVNLKPLRHMLCFHNGRKRPKRLTVLDF